MDKKISQELNELKNVIKSGNFTVETKKVREWGGTDVIIAKKMTPNIKRWLEDQPAVLSFQETVP